MKTIPFNISQRDLIEKGKYRVETKDGRKVRIICWDAKNIHSIITLIEEGGIERITTFTNSSTEDLVTIVPDSSSFKRTLESYLDILQKPFSQEISETLLNLAKEELREEILNENTPKWRKNQPEEKYIHHNGYYLTYTELEKLPKE